jgi:putative addiction module component (TIGR02574 family)
MSSTLEEIEQAALGLPPKDRAQLVDKLWESLDHTTYPHLSQEWVNEIKRRRQEFAEGKVKAIPGQEVSRKARKVVTPAR